MVNQTNTVRVFVVASSEPVRRKLLRMFDDIPLVKLVGIESGKRVVPQKLTALEPDLLVVNLDPRETTEHGLFDHVSQHLPRCRTIVLSKDLRTASSGLAAETCRNPMAGSAFVDPDDQTRLRTEIQKSADEKNRRHAAHPLAHPDGSPGYLYDYLEYISNSSTDPASPQLASDVVERRRTQAGRRRVELNCGTSAERFQTFVEQLPGIPYIASLDDQGSIIYVSPRIAEYLGFTPAQWCNDPLLRISRIHPDDRHLVLNATRRAISHKGSYSIDYRIYGLNDQIRWFHDEARVMVDDSGRAIFLQGALLDITERKQAQEELERSHAELQDLIDVLDSLRLEEQKRLAHEMHDDFGQLLAAMKIDLGTLQQYLPQADSQVAKYLSSINLLVDTMVTSVRRIIADLPPKIVEDLGLFNAVKLMVDSFKERHRIACRLYLSKCEPELDVRKATAAYRMIQEALNNVAKHAEASSVEIWIRSSSKRLAIRVSDNGKGMSQESLHKAGSFGLIGIRERVAALGGSLRIESTAGKGTSIIVIVHVCRQASQPHHGGPTDTAKS